MKEQYRDITFRNDKLAMVNLCNGIVEIYQRQGLRLSLRQLYYQLVTRNAIRNEERSYKAIGKLVSDARLAGLIDWNAIEDRVRIPRLPMEFNSFQDLVDAALNSYRLPRWNGQPFYIELWVEKDALSGVLSPLAIEYHVTLMVNRGYSSQSAMYEAAERFKRHKELSQLLYLGDHDPSGEDMVRDIQDRLDMFGASVLVKKIALTSEQVALYNPPPNPTKVTDTRANGYIEKHGNECWEVDALPPDVLHSIVEKAILEHLDTRLMDEIKEHEEVDKAHLKEAMTVKAPVTAIRNTNKCLKCGAPLAAQRGDSLYCSPKCKQAAYRDRVNNLPSGATSENN